ncbi:GAF domain-containing protein [Solirubrobacter ginsenosidimutans]|uniref:GAF domain-containing protein n=1 Tax=Solirubrobacter ginsenosidimutans TaxID=490573 RepID=A0A9X3RYI3_9ACTN|nr:GAF domain-containing protein [Solirubrobacter ginsenosidimutans]MDA0159209.1 GAF domain-containing protein [Solirubrobacter ginsenosidimutans]
MSRHRRISALLVDVPAGHAAQLSRVLDDAGWTARAVPVQGAEALSAALQRRGWDAVLYGGDGPLAVPSRKALEMVRLADPHLPFLAVSPRMRPGELAAILRGLPTGVPTVPDMAQLPAVLTRELEQARMRRRVGGAHKLLGAQQAIADHLAAGLEPSVLCDRVLATLCSALGWTFGAVWRPDGSILRCTSVFSAPGARTPVAELASATHEQTYAAGQGLAGRVWAFRRPVWVADLPGEAVRAGLVTAVAFPIALGDECVGVIELYAPDAREPNAEVSALFATVGGQLAAYFARRRVRARARRSFDGAAALIVALDADGRVEIANGTASAAFGFEEDDLVGRDWFAVAVPEPDRPAARAAYASLLDGTATTLPDTPGITWRWSPSRDPHGNGLGALGWGEPT